MLSFSLRALCMALLLMCFTMCSTEVTDPERVEAARTTYLTLLAKAKLEAQAARAAEAATRHEHNRKALADHAAGVKVFGDNVLQKVCSLADGVKVFGDNALQKVCSTARLILDVLFLILNVLFGEVRCRPILAFVVLLSWSFVVVLVVLFCRRKPTAPPPPPPPPHQNNAGENPHGARRSPKCSSCGVSGHYKKKCPRRNTAGPAAATTGD